MMLPGNRYAVFYNHQYKKEQNFIDHKKPAIDTTQQPHNRLHQTDPQKIVYLVATDRAHRNT